MKSENRQVWRRWRMPLLTTLFGIALLPLATASEWTRHTIDNSARGADGVRLGDINGDGLPDITTGWEESGIVRVYLHPGHQRVRERWPAVTVGKVKSPEDAVFVDANGDGVLDVVSSCEGNERNLYIHWAPKVQAELLNAASWQTVPITKSGDRQQMWMYALPFAPNNDNTPRDIIAGSKGNNATVSRLTFDRPTDGAVEWKLHPICAAGWIMSLIKADVDRDGDWDVLVSDRKGPRRGVFWLEHSGSAPRETWIEHRIGLNDREVMFIDFVDWNGDGRGDVLAAVKPRSIAILEQPDDLASAWRESLVELPDNLGSAKSVRAADLNRDGKLDLVFSCEDAKPPKSGVIWMERDPSMKTGWRFHELSGAEGVKFDRIELADLDGDGDLDVLTCEETANLGVIWYENR